MSDIADTTVNGNLVASGNLGPAEAAGSRAKSETGQADQATATAAEVAATSTLDEKAKIILRDGQDDDWPFLYNNCQLTYASSSRRKSPFAFGTPFQVLSAKLDMLRFSPAWKLTVACPDYEPTEILGLCLYRHKPRPNREHLRDLGWLFVKPDYRNKGVGTALLNVANLASSSSYINNNRTPHDITPTINCAFMMPEALRFLDGRGFDVVFRPYIPDAALWETIQQRRIENEG